MLDGKMTGLQVLLASFAISVIILAVFFGYIWAVKKWKERRGKLNTQNSTLTL